MQHGRRNLEPPILPHTAARVMLAVASATRAQCCGVELEAAACAVARERIVQGEFHRHRLACMPFPFKSAP
jgi:hypothetical protein